MTGSTFGSLRNVGLGDVQCLRCDTTTTHLVVPGFHKKQFDRLLNSVPSWAKKLSKKGVKVVVNPKPEVLGAGTVLEAFEHLYPGNGGNGGGGIVGVIGSGGGGGSEDVDVAEGGVRVEEVGEVESDHGSGGDGDDDDGFEEE